MKTSPRSSVLIDLAAIRSNVAHLSSLLQPGARMLVAVKADGYGHGTLPVARSVVAAGACGVAVATAEEAVALRDAGFDDMILVMGPLYSFDQYEEMARQSVDFAVVSDHMAAVLPQLQGSGLRARVHLKIDSGMNRQGLFPAAVDAFLESIRGIPEIELAGVMTHFACVTEDPSDHRRSVGAVPARGGAGAPGMAAGGRSRRQQRGHGIRSPLPFRHGALRLRRLRPLPLAARRPGGGTAAGPVLEVPGGARETGGERRGRRLRPHLPGRASHRRRPGPHRLRRRGVPGPG